MSGQVLLQTLAANKNKLNSMHNKFCNRNAQTDSDISFYDEIPDCCRQILDVLAVKTGLFCWRLAVQTKIRVGVFGSVGTGSWCYLYKVSMDFGG